MIPLASFSINKRIIISFCIFAMFAAAAEFAGAFQRSEMLTFGTDTLMTLTRALAGRHPEMFAQDFLFSKPENYSFYLNANVGFFSALDAAGITDFTTWYHALNMLTVALHLLGWFLLGLQVFRNAPAAAAFSIACAVYLPVVSGDYWGISREPQARQLFSVALPFIFFVALQAQQSFLRWMITFALMGGAMWLHPASAPPVALAMLIAMMAAHYDKERPIRILLCAVAGGIVFLAFAIPSLWQYYVGVRDAGKGADPSLVTEALALRFAADYVSPVNGIANGLQNAFGGWRLVLPLCAVILTVMQFRAGRWSESSPLRFFVVVTVMVLLLGGGIPVIEQGIETAAGANPSQLDLIRSLRYLVPLTLMLAFLGISHTHLGSRGMVLCSLGLACYWIFAGIMGTGYRQPGNISTGIGCWLKGSAVCSPKQDNGIGQAAQWLLTAKGGTVFSPDYGLAIRAFQHRPLAFDWKDAGWLAYSNRAKLVENLDHLKDYVRLDSWGKSATSTDWLRFASGVDAGYVVLKDDGTTNDPKYALAFRAGSVSIYQARDTSFTTN